MTATQREAHRLAFPRKIEVPNKESAPRKLFLLFSLFSNAIFYFILVVKIFSTNYFHFFFSFFFKHLKNERNSYLVCKLTHYFLFPLSTVLRMHRTYQRKILTTSMTGENLIVQTLIVLIFGWIFLQQSSFLFS